MVSKARVVGEMDYERSVSKMSGVGAIDLVVVVKQPISDQWRIDRFEMQPTVTTDSRNRR